MAEWIELNTQQTRFAKQRKDVLAPPNGLTSQISQSENFFWLNDEWMTSRSSGWRVDGRVDGETLRVV